MILGKTATTTIAAAGLIALVLQFTAGTSARSLAQAPRLEFRVVVASKPSLLRQLNEAGRDGFACLMLARTEPGAGLPAVVAILSRVAGGENSPATHRLVTGNGGDVDAAMDRAGGEGFRLCGAVLNEEPPAPAVITILSRRAGVPVESWRYRSEVMSNYKASLARLNTAAQDGFVPVAATATNSNRVPEMRTWMVILERPSGPATARDIVTRAGPGPSGLQKGLNEQGKLGYRIDLLWREGGSYVAMMSHPTAEPVVPRSYTADDNTRSAIRFVSHPLLADFPYLDRRLLVADASVSASNEVVEDPIPPPGPLGYVEARALTILGDHLSRSRGYVPALAMVGSNGQGGWVLTTVMTQREK